MAEQIRGTPAGDIFLREGQAPRAGDMLHQPALADTLERLSDLGAADFYLGGTARRIVRDMKRNGGLIDAGDLGRLELPVDVEPIAMDYRGYRVLTVAPPGGGQTLLDSLNVLDRLGARDASDDEESWYERIAWATCTALRAREGAAPASRGLAPGFAPRSSDARHAVAVHARRGGGAFMVPGSPYSAEGPGDTTHLVTADRFGNVVSLTQSIQSVFGAKVASRELGFVYNNYLCTCPRRAHPFALAPGCRPRSNAAPVLVLHRDGGRPVLALGAAGSRRILSAVLQVLSRVLDRGEGLAEAVSAPRVHGLLSGKVWMERPAASPALLARLGVRFAQVRIRPARSYAMGAVQALRIGADGTLCAAADPRRDGAAEVMP